MTQPASEEDLKPINIGARIQELSGVTIEELARINTTQVFVDTRESTWRNGKGAPVPSYAGHTIVWIAPDFESEDVRIYGAPIARLDLTPQEKKAMENHAGEFITWTVRRDNRSLLIETTLDPESFCAMVAKEIKEGFDAFSEEVFGSDALEDVMDYLKKCAASGLSAQAVVEGIEKGEHQEEDETPEPS